MQLTLSRTWHSHHHRSTGLCARQAVYVLLVILEVTLLSASAGNTSSVTVTKYEPDRVITSDLDPLEGRGNRIKELELGMEEGEALTLTMLQEKQVTVNFTLYCAHPSISYTLSLYTENMDVALVRVDTPLSLVHITCKDTTLHESLPSPGPQGNTSLADAVPSPPHDGHPPSSDEGRGSGVSLTAVRGGFTFTLQADLLGRTWLHVHAERHADPGVVLPELLLLPWTTQPRIQPNVTSGGTDSIRPPVNVTSGRGSASYDVMTSLADGESGEVEKRVVTVLRVVRPVDRAFRAVLYGFVMLSTVGMGCKTELSVVREVLRRPVAPAIGFVCQYLFMPLIAFTVARLVVIGNPAVALGIFTCGICPGGGPSNLFSYLLDGDVSLSVTMTALSSIAALAMIPLWLFTLGSLFEDDKISLNVPFGRIIMTLTIIIVPLLVGLAVKRWLPRAAKWILKVLKPFTLIVIVFLLTFGIYTNLYVFRLFSPQTLLAGCMLPYVGYILGGTVSLLLRQPYYRVKTIAIETGIQNTSIAYLLLVFSLPAPDGDMAAVGPMASAIMTPLPLFLLVVGYLLYKRFCRKKEEEGGKTRGGGGSGGDEGEGEEGESTAFRGEQNGKSRKEPLEKDESVGKETELGRGEATSYDKGEETVAILDKPLDNRV